MPTARPRRTGTQNIILIQTISLYGNIKPLKLKLYYYFLLSRGRISCKFDLFFRVDFNKQNTYKMALFTKEFNMDEVPVLPYSDIKAPHKLRKLLIERDEEIEELKKQLRVAKLVTKKLNKDVKTTRDKWYDETALLVKSQIANRREIVMLKEQIRCPGCPLQLEDDEELREEIKASSYLK